jgi:hypothetical protein
VINQSTALVRRLKQFFDQRMGLNIWDQGKVTHFGQDDDDVQEYVEYRSTVNGKRFTVKITPADDEASDERAGNPLATLEFHMGSVGETGPFDLETLERIRARLLGNSLEFDRSLIGGFV